MWNWQRQTPLFQDTIILRDNHLPSAYQWLEAGPLPHVEFKIVMADGADSKILARASLDIAGAAYMAAVAKYPLRNMQLRRGAQIIRRHDGEQQPEPPPDPTSRAGAPT
jgi:hypothetical protein